MSAAKKVKVSLTISADLLERVDSAARRERKTRSYLVEQWLNAGASRAAERAIELDMIRYYTTRTAEERADDEAIARGSSLRAREIDYDAPSRPRRSRRKPR